MSSSSESLAHAVGFVKRGKNRKKVFLVTDGVKTPSEIAESAFGSRSATNLSIVSRALAELKEEGILENPNPQDKTGRIYRDTRTGFRVREIISNYTR